MKINFIADNLYSLVLLLCCLLALAGLDLYARRYQRQKHTFITHLIQLIIWFCIIAILGKALNSAITIFRLTIITPDMVSFICTSLIALILIIKLFAMINVLERKEISKGRDITSSHIISRILKISIVVIMLLLYGEHFGMSFSGLLTFGGIGGLAVGMAGKDILSNFFSGIMLYFDRPFNIGDWIRSPDRNIEGTVAEIGWRITKIITFDHRPLYVPNSVFSAISVENPGRMTNRRITTTVGLRYEDANKVKAVVQQIEQMLRADSHIDQQKTLLVYFNGFGDSSLNIMVYCFTKTTVWAEWLSVQQQVFLKIIDIVHHNGADFAFPSQTLYIENAYMPAPERS